MKQTIWLILLFISFADQALSQETSRSQFSSVPDASRFEIIQSEIAAKITLKIDKYTGNVFQMVKGNKGLFWQLIESEIHPEDKATVDKVNYQVFTSGIAIRMTYLINVNTGATWQLSESDEIGVFWKILK